MTKRYEFFLKGRPHSAKPYHLKGVGLPNVYLLNGFKIEVDPHYGRLVTIEKLPSLHKAIGLRLVLKKGPLTGDELRFLRKQMKWTQVELGASLGVTHQTVANYEKGKTGKGETGAGAADIAVRFLYLSHIAPDKEKAALCKYLAHRALAPGEEQPAAKLTARTHEKISGNWSEAELVAV
jgi:transcriptional regulator with XRE-family HTH domain